MAHGTDPLKLDDGVLREIAQELYRKFRIVSSNMTIHVDQHGILIWIHTDAEKLILPRGPREVKITDDNHPILRAPEF